MNSDFNGLAAYGWSTHFHAQLSAAEPTTLLPVRVVGAHRGVVDVESPGLSARLPQLDVDDPLDRATVGDWLLVDASSHRPARVLERKSLFKRRAAGTGRELQLVAANVDTLLIVTSCNHDFNVARLERYLVLARDAGVHPVVVLTKADLADPGDYAAEARRLAPGLLVEPLDARDPGEVDRLRFWCGPGETVALLGSSGVGKSTLVNTLLGTAAQDTGGIRDHDSHGRHTTTGRLLLRMPAGGWLLDTPGMRELQLTDVGHGIDEVFDDVVRLAARCRFHDCRHDTEPGCAVQEAIAAGELDAARLKRYRKLEAEDRHNSETIAESRARSRRFGRLTRSALQDKRLRNGNDP